MRLPVAAVVAALLAAIGFVPLPAIGAAAPDFALSCGSSTAGDDVPCTVRRPSGGKGLYVLFETSDGSARAGVDYTTVKQLLYFKANALTQTVEVHTAVNPSASGTLTFNAVIAASTVVVRAAGSIVEPAPPPPPPPPPPAQVSWVAAPLVDGGYARCKNPNGCRQSFAPYNPVAKFGDVYVMSMRGSGIGGGYTMTLTATAWVTVDDNFPTHSFEPLDKVGVPYAGFTSLLVDWEGVAPAS